MSLVVFDRGVTLRSLKRTDIPYRREPESEPVVLLTPVNGYSTAQPRRQASPHLTATVEEFAASLQANLSPRCRWLDWVMVQGEIVVEKGRPTRIDERAILAELVPPYLRAYAETEQANRAYEPHFAELLRRSASVELAR
jgi:hypothetical protein